MKKLKVAILFGGKSAEHEVSLQSARNIYEAMDKEKYEPVLIGIDKSGKWHLNDAADYLINAEDPKLIRLKSVGPEAALLPQSEGRLIDISDNQAERAVDVVFPILHGTFGEDGTIQGLLKLADIPFVGAGVLGSAVGMDKDVMKRLLRDSGLPIGKFITIKASEPIPSYATVTAAVGAPCFVKPANMGSSVGVSKAKDESGYLAAVANAFQYDNKILVEEFIPGREIECSVLGNENPIASMPGEVAASHEFYSYEAKYIDENGARVDIPAKIPDEVADRIKELAVQTFQALDCAGLGRVDFFLKESGEVIINEINTLPGFTKISMYPKMWEASGIGYSELIDRLIQFALERHEKEKKLRTSYV